MSDRPHRWARVIRAPQELQVVPHEMLAALAAMAPAAKPPAHAKPASAVAAHAGEGPVIDRARRHLEKMPPAIQGQDGSGRTFAAACALVVGFGLSVEAALPLLTQYSDRCEPPWTEPELLHKLDDARKCAEEEPAKVGHLLARGKAPTPEDLQAWNPFAGSAGDLPKPIPIQADLRPVPPLPLQFLPEPFRAWTSDIARRVGCPLEYVAIAAIIAVAAVVGRRLAIRPKRRDDWTVVANLWGAIVGRPGVLKTPALQEALRPLNRLAREAEDEFQAESKAFECQADLKQLQHDAARKRYQAALGAKHRDETLIAELEEQIQAPPDGAAPVRRRYLVNDATVEKLLEILRENPNGVLQFRDELVGFLRTLEKTGRETDRAFFLEAWNGTGGFTCDRIGRGSVRAEAICISLLGGIQPGPLAGYIRGATRGNGGADDGLIGRFQLLVYPDPPEKWQNVDQYPDGEAKNRAFEVFQQLAALDPGVIGAELDEVKGGPPFLRFAEPAQALFDEWREHLENEKLRSEGESPLIESHISKYRSLMPSLALLFHLVGVVDGAPAGPVSLTAAQQAAAWCDFLEEHARRVYEASSDGDFEPARRLAARIRRGSLPSPFTARMVAEHDWSGLASQDEVDRAVATLERLNWVGTVEVATGGRPRTWIFVNPRVLQGAAP